MVKPLNSVQGMTGAATMIAALICLALPALAADSTDSALPIERSSVRFGDIEVSSQGILATPQPIENFHSMELRIGGPQGEVYHATSFGEPLSWSCDGCLEGGYSAEIRVVVRIGVRQTDEGPKPVLRVKDTTSRRFISERGWLSLVQRETETGVEQNKSSGVSE